MRQISADLTQEEVAALVCTTLERHNVDAVLCGGAVVSIYSDNEYESMDLDFVPLAMFPKVKAAMEELGFRTKGRHWVHPSTSYYVDFSPYPVEVGEEGVVTDFAERDTTVGRLRLLKPTDCVIDRLAGYYHWSDQQCLDQAIAVASRHPVEIERIESWSLKVGKEAEFAEFRDRLQRAR